MYWLVFNDANYNLAGHTGYCYVCMIKDTYTIINYHVQYLILDEQKMFGKLNWFNLNVVLFFVYLIYRIIQITDYSYMHVAM